MNSLREFKEFVDELNMDSGRNYKLSVLEKYKDNENIKYYLEFLLNSYKTTGISDKKFNKATVVHTSLTCGKSVKDLLEYLLKHNTGTDEVISEINSFRAINCLPADLKPIFTGLITKNFPLGIDAKSVNKVIPNLIPEFSIQLAEKYFEHPEYVEGKEFAITRKIDGGRIIAIKENGEISFYTRAGQKYEGLVDLENELISIPGDFVLDGELTLLDAGDLDSGEQYKQTMKISRTKDLEKHGLKMLVFDWLPVADFKNQISTISYSDRRNELNSIFDKFKLTYFERLPILYQGTDTTMITKILNEQVARGEEGVMINICSAPYHFRRTKDLMKCKLFNDVDLEIVGFEPGTNKNKDRLGAVIVKYKDNLVGVGSGFTDEQRKEIWEHQDNYLGKTLVVKYFEETTNADGTYSLRFPIAVDIRDDK